MFTTPLNKTMSICLIVLIMLSFPVYYFNTGIFWAINGFSYSLLDPLMGVISGLGDGLLVVLIIAVFTLFHLRLGLAALAAFLLSGLLAQLLKRIFDMPRPPALFENVHLLGHALQNHSFPSGHATSCAVMMLLPFLLWSSKDWRPWVFALPFLCAALGRIYGGVHFPFDVFIGVILGLSSMWLCWLYSARWPTKQWQSAPWFPRIAGLIVLIEAAVLGLGYQMQPVTAQLLAGIAPPLALLILLRYWKQSLIKSNAQVDLP